MRTPLATGRSSPSTAIRWSPLRGRLDDILNDGKKGSARKHGFVLLVFPFGASDGGRTNFISNGANRKDIVTLFKEMIARFEGQPEVEGQA